jgi:hypothetical protein
MLTIINNMLEEYKRKLAIKYLRSLFIKHGYSNIGLIPDEQIEQGIACLALLVRSSKLSFEEVVHNLHHVGSALDVDNLREAASNRVESVTRDLTTLFGKRNMRK